MTLSRVFSYLRSALWFIPLLYAVAGIAINAITTAIDRATAYDLLPTVLVGGPDAALAILSTVAASMITLVATVLAITMVVIQLAMAQFSPRIVQTFLQDKPSQNAIGLFVATFVQAILTMREVLVSEDRPIVPGLSVLVTFSMVVVDIVVLVVYIHHIGRSLRVSALIELVGENTRDLIDKTCSTLTEKLPSDPYLVTARNSGVLVLIGHDKIVRLASAADAYVELVPALGQFVPAGAPLARLHGARPHDIDVDELRSCLVLRMERTLDQDVAFGLRMLVDMGIKAISESPYADPTTSVQVIDRIHDLMRQLAGRDLPDGTSRDAAGTVRLSVPSMDWQAYVRLAFEELRLAGAHSTQVARRLRACLEDLVQMAPADRQAPITEQLDLLEQRMASVTDGEPDRHLALDSDSQGIGVAASSLRG